MEFFGAKLPYTRKIAYTAVLTALCAVVNMFSIDIAGVFKLSFVTAVCMMIAYLCGPFLGAGIAFLGDLIGFLMIPSPYAYSPYIGLCNALFTLIVGVVYMLATRKTGYVWASIIALFVAHIISSVFLNSYIVSTLYSQQGFWVIVGQRILFQTPVNIVNGVLAVLLVKSLSKITSLGLPNPDDRQS